MLVGPGLEDIGVVVREVLVSGSPRLIAALAPVLVANIDKVRFAKLRATLAEAGLERRLLWLLDNVRLALNAALNGNPTRLNARRYGRALVVLATFLDGDALAAPAAQPPSGREILDADIRSEKSRERVWEAASEVSRRWGVVTALQPEDFRVALEEAGAA